MIIIVSRRTKKGLKDSQPWRSRPHVCSIWKPYRSFYQSS